MKLKTNHNNRRGEATLALFVGAGLLFHLLFFGIAYLVVPKKPTLQLPPPKSPDGWEQISPEQIQTKL